jgi:predicted NBD/HSP70 family sugar kinase
MEFFSGLDVGMDETAICVVDDKGKVVLQTTVVTDPDAIKLALKPYLGRPRRVGHGGRVFVRRTSSAAALPKPQRSGRYRPRR